MSRFTLFDRSRLRLRDLDERGHDLAACACAPLGCVEPSSAHPDLPQLANRIRTARRGDRPVILFFGGHVIKLGLSRFLIDLVERGLVTHLATNGAGLIHDFELALVGGTSEDVARWIAAGQFGLWQQTSRLNDIIGQAAQQQEGLGEAVGRVIEDEPFPQRNLSVAAAAGRCGIPLTCHVTIGADILHAHPNCDGAALGRASYTDFLIFARAVQDLEGGVYLNVGSAVTGPEVYLKALAMARNLAHQDGREVRRFTTAVFDLISLPDGWRVSAPGKENPLYYFRPWKTILVRTVADGGQSFYVCGDHRQTLPTLWHWLVHQEGHCHAW